MIQINYIGTVDRDWLMEENPEYLHKTIIDKIQECLRESDFSVAPIAWSDSPNLSNDKVLMCATVNLHPRDFSLN